MNREVFINNLEINHPYIRSCLDNFIDKHGELYGRVVIEIVEMTLPTNNTQIFASKYHTVLPSKAELKKLLEE